MEDEASFDQVIEEFQYEDAISHLYTDVDGHDDVKFIKLSDCEEVQGGKLYV